MPIMVGQRMRASLRRISQLTRENPKRFAVSDTRWKRTQHSHELNYWTEVFPEEVPESQGLQE